MRKLLITGGSGFLGGYLVRGAAAAFDVAATWHEHRGADEGVEWIRMDLADSDRVERVLRRIEPEVVIHAAALSRVEKCERSPALAAVLNQHAAAVLARVCGSLGARLISISTDLVFNGLDSPYTESSPVTPVNVYGITKAAGELEVRSGGGDHVIVRPALMYGAPLGYGESSSEWMRNRWAAGEVTPLYIDQYRTPVFAGEVAEALLEIAGLDFQGVVHLGGPDRINRFEFGRMLAKHLGVNESLIRPVHMSEIKTPGRRSPDITLRSESIAGRLKTRFSGCRDGIRRAYPS